MAEITEYSLIFLVSTLFVAGSVATFDSFMTYETQVGVRADFAAISALASHAVAAGASEGNVSTGVSSVSCEAGTLSFASGSLTMSSNLPVGCSFRLSLSSGVHTLRFSMEPSGLVLRVV